MTRLVSDVADHSLRTKHRARGRRRRRTRFGYQAAANVDRGRGRRLDLPGALVRPRRRVPARGVGRAQLPAGAPRHLRPARAQGDDRARRLRGPSRPRRRTSRSAAGSGRASRATRSWSASPRARWPRRRRSCAEVVAADTAAATTAVAAVPGVMAVAHDAVVDAVVVARGRIGTADRTPDAVIAERVARR